MSNESVLRSPLADFDFRPKPLLGKHSERVRLREVPNMMLTNVRIDGSLSIGREAIHRLAGLALPVTPNTVSCSADCVAMWLAPDEWLLRWQGTERNYADELEQALRNTFCAINDVSSGYAVLELAGTRARDVLSKGCPLDFHPRAFGDQHCAQSHFFKASVLVRPVNMGGEDAWEILVRRSFADYAAHMLLDAMQEYLD